MRKRNKKGVKVAYLIGVAMVSFGLLYVCPLSRWLIGNQSYFILKAVPVAPEAYNVSTSAVSEFYGWTTNYNIDWKVEDLIEYYTPKLLAQGWSIQTAEEEVGRSGATWMCLKAEHFGFTTVFIDIIPYATGRGESGTTSAVAIRIPPARSICAELNSYVRSQLKKTPNGV